MANEDQKDFNAMLQDCKDMPKTQIITDQKSIEKYGCILSIVMQQLFEKI